MEWACQLIEGLEEINFKFTRCGGFFKCVKIDDRALTGATDRLEKTN